MAKGQLQPTLVEILCRCGKPINVRTEEVVKRKSCWQCSRVVEVHLFSGRGKVSAYIENADGTERQQLLHDRYTVVWQA